MINDLKQKFYSGTSGIALTLPKRSFPIEFQDKSRLHYYASLFNSLEINSSFYKLPMLSTVSKWADSVPPGFQFTFKLWKTITHNKGLDFNPEDIDHFLKIIDQAGDKKGCLLLQFPPSLTITYLDHLKKLLKHLRKANTRQQWKPVIEFRNKSWYQQEVYDTLHHYNAAMVIHDHPSSATPLINSKTAFVYLRFHGPDSGYRGSYTNEFLEEQALHIRSWLKERKIVYVYFNNTLGDAAKNLMLLNDLVGR